MPISCLLPISMPYISRTNPTFCTKQAQLLNSHPLFTKYDDQQHTATTTAHLLRSVQKPRFRVTSYVSLKPDCFELESENSKDDDDHVHDPLRTVSDLMETQKKKLLAVVIGAVSVCYSYKALAASGGVMGGDSFSSYSSSSDSSWSSSSSSDDDSSWSLSYSSSSSSPSSSYSSSSSSPSSSYSYSSPSPSSSSSSDDSSWSSSSDTDYESELSKPYRSTSRTYKSRSSSKPSGSTYSESGETSKYTTSTSVAPEITSTKTQTSSTEGLGILIVVVSILGIAVFCAIRKNTPQNATRVIHESTPQKTRVIKFQVALLGSARSFQRDINEIAKVADTSSRRALKIS